MNNDQPPVPEEPNILDYLKSKLKFWERGNKINPYRLEAAPPQLAGQETPVISQPEKPEMTEKPRKKITRTGTWPWRSLGAIVFARLGQRAFEPSPNRTAASGLVLYGIGIAWLILAYLRKEWTLVPYPEKNTESADVLRVKPVQLILGIMVSVAAFLTLGRNLFTPLNVTLWVLAISLFTWAFWQLREDQPPFWPRVKEFFRRDSWQLIVTRWTLLALAVIGIVFFFRVYNIGGVPAEPFSDHAEKLLDVFDVSQGHIHIFFPRNTGREAIQMYLTLVVSWVFGTGLSFLSLKIGTVFCGLATLPYLYLLGKEFGGKRIGLIAVFFAGIAYWPNVISRVGLRFPLYPLFAAPTLYYLLRGLRTRRLNDLIISGLFLGLGLHGYSPFRIMPLVVVAAVGLYVLHAQSKGNRKQAVIWLSILALISLMVFLPLARFWLDNPLTFDYRALTRFGSIGSPLPAPAWQIFLANTWNSLGMFNWDNGGIWVHSVPNRPALDVVSAALFLIGVVLVLARYIREHHWQDLFLLLSIPLLQLPSILSLAFPGENPSLNRPAGAILPVFLIVAVAMDGLLKAIQAHRSRLAGTVLVWVVALSLAGLSAYQNYDLVFNQYATEFRQGSWNTSEIADVVRHFGQAYGTVEDAWVVPYPYWVDTRLVGVWLGLPNKDFALWPQDFNTTLDIQGAKEFILKPEDTADVELLRQLYPQGVLSTFHSALENAGKDFLIFFVPPAN